MEAARKVLSIVHCPLSIVFLLIFAGVEGSWKEDEL